MEEKHPIFFSANLTVRLGRNLKYKTVGGGEELKLSFYLFQLMVIPQNSEQ